MIEIFFLEYVGKFLCTFIKYFTDFLLVDPRMRWN